MNMQHIYLKQVQNGEYTKYYALMLKCFINNPQRGSSWIPTPDRYNNARCGLINIRNEDDQECFKWCAKYHLSKKEKHSDRVSVLKENEDKYNYSNVNYPATFDDIAIFENNNKIAIRVYGIYEEHNIRTERSGNIDYIQNDIIYSLRVEGDETSHYIYIEHI